VIEVAGSSFGHPLRFKDTLSEEILMMCMEGVASSIIRKETLEEVADLGLSVYGDGGWRGMLGFTKAKVFGPIPYSRDGIAKLFVASKINLNISRVQFKTAINQRPFDVACAGGFILTDYRRDIGELFELGKEMVCYRDKEELRELSIYFLKHPEERREIAMKAKKRILEEHTFKRRIQRMLEVVREVFGI
jgi:spore maturation protein CgeB